jgi:PAS domain S-box-containing protein
MEKAGEIQVGIDQNSCVTMWNEAAEVMSWFSAAESIGLDFADDFLTEEARPVFETMQQQCLDGTEMEGFRMTFFRKDGVPLEMLVCARPQTNTDGSVFGCLLTASAVPHTSDAAAEVFAKLEAGHKAKGSMLETLSNKSTTMDSMESFCDNFDELCDV